MDDEIKRRAAWRATYADKTDEEIRLFIEATTPGHWKKAEWNRILRERQEARDAVAADKVAAKDAERQRKDDERHRQKLAVDRQRNTIALWALGISALALVVAVVALARTWPGSPLP